ncbi:MAG TPA: hypothetical protein VL572_00520 [Pyrinomonadaceae bacterium]|nr:hypothetical protein [Pyrinomonadaceae bacterium]
MKAKMVLAALPALLCLAAISLAQGTIVLYDPLVKSPETADSPSDEAFVKEKLVPKVQARWGEDDACNGSNLNIVGSVEGSFTRAGAKQRAIVYELCQTGNGFANNGLAVIENGQVVAHFAEEGGWDLEVSRVSDLNKNGRDEIVIETGGGMHQGYTGTSVTVLELTQSSVTDFGTFLAFTNECENHASNKYCDRSYKLTATAGAKPLFFSQKFTNRGTDEKPRWVVAGKPLPAKNLGEITRKFEAVK